MIDQPSVSAKSLKCSAGQHVEDVHDLGLAGKIDAVT